MITVVDSPLPYHQFILFFEPVSSGRVQQSSQRRTHTQHQLNSIFFSLVHVSRSIDLRIVRCVVTSAHTFNKFSIRRSFVALRRYLRNAITKHVIICSIKTYTLRVYGAFIYFIYLWMLSQHQITCNHNHTSVRFEIEYGMNRTNVGGVK